MNEFDIIEEVTDNYIVTAIKRKGKSLLMAIELPKEKFNKDFEYFQNIEQYHKKGNCGFYYVILKFELT